MTENLSPKSPKKKWNKAILNRRERLTSKDLSNLPGKKIF